MLEIKCLHLVRSQQPTRQIQDHDLARAVHAVRTLLAMDGITLHAKAGRDRGEEPAAGARRKLGS